MGKSGEITFVSFVVKSFRRVARWISACAGMTAGAGSATADLRSLTEAQRHGEKRGCLWTANRAVHDDRFCFLLLPLRASVAP